MIDSWITEWPNILPCQKKWYNEIKYLEHEGGFYESDLKILADKFEAQGNLP